MTRRPWRRLLAALLVAALGWGMPVAGCEDLSDLASFIDSDFADISAEVTEMSGDEVGELMDELMLRFRMYLALRDLIPFSVLGEREQCMRDVDSSSRAFGFMADVNCIYGDDFAPAEGFIVVDQEQLADHPVVIGLDVVYDGVLIGETDVEGTEVIVETATDDGASIRTLDMVQDGVELKYEFRLGMVDGETPVFDYEIKAKGGKVFARITNPRTAGQFVTVIVQGLDGILQCEIRDSAWAPGEAARGTCCDQEFLEEDGACLIDRLVFGIPEGPGPN